VLGLGTGALLSQVPVLDVLRQFVSNPWVRWISNILAVFGGGLVTVYGTGIWNWIDPTHPQQAHPPFRIWGSFLLGLLLIFVQSALTIPGAAGAYSYASYIEDLSVPDDTVLAPGQVFKKGWRLYNAGTADWRLYELHPRLGPFPTLAVKPFPIPNTPSHTDVNVYTPDLVAPTTPGCYRTNFQVNVPGTPAQPFGDVFYLQLVVREENQQNYVVFVDDLNVRDGTLMTPGQPFVKGWQFHNCGDNTWTGYRARQIKGNFGPPDIAIPTIAPHQDLLLWATMLAPTVPDNYTAWYQLEDAAGQPFGSPFSVNIKTK
jgi:hypothetical protein